MGIILDRDTSKKLEIRLDEYSKYGASLYYLYEEKRVRINDLEKLFFSKDDDKSCFIYNNIIRHLTTNDLKDSYNRYSNIYPNSSNYSKETYNDELNKVFTKKILDEISASNGNHIDKRYINTYNYLLSNYNIK